MPQEIILAVIWIALMLTYLLGDVLRIFSGDFAKLRKDMEKITPQLWLFISVIMLIPIVMSVLSLLLPTDANRVANIVAAGFLFLFNLVGLPTYPSAYDRFLIVVGMGFNVLTIITAIKLA